MLELPITAAVLRDAPISLADIVSQSKMVRAHLHEAGVERARDPGTAPSAPILMVRMVPETVFDDEDWSAGTNGTGEEKRLRGWDRKGSRVLQRLSIPDGRSAIAVPNTIPWREATAKQLLRPHNGIEPASVASNHAAVG